MAEFKLRRITPTLQQIMNNELGKINDALDNADVRRAFTCMQTLVDTLREEDQKTMRPHIEKLQKKLQAVNGGTTLDFHTRKRTINEKKLAILFREIRPLHRKLSALLHTQGYLEHRSRTVDSNIRPDQNVIETKGKKEEHLRPK